jgi:hypothetical protein
MLSQVRRNLGAQFEKKTFLQMRHVEAQDQERTSS